MVRRDTSTVVVGLTAFSFIAFVLVMLLKYVIYDNDNFFKNIILMCSILCTRYFLYSNNRSLRAQEKACLVLFMMYDRDLLDFSNVFLLFGIACIRAELRKSPPSQELVTFVCALVFLLMGWFSVGKILILYNFSFLLAIPLLIIVFTIKAVMNGMRWIERED